MSVTHTPDMLAPACGSHDKCRGSVGEDGGQGGVRCPAAGGEAWNFHSSNTHVRDVCQITPPWGVRVRVRVGVGLGLLLIAFILIGSVFVVFNTSCLFNSSALMSSSCVSLPCVFKLCSPLFPEQVCQTSSDDKPSSSSSSSSSSAFSF